LHAPSRVTAKRKLGEAHLDLPPHARSWLPASGRRVEHELAEEARHLRGESVRGLAHLTYSLGLMAGQRQAALPLSADKLEQALRTLAETPAVAPRFSGRRERSRGTGPLVIDERVLGVGDLEQ
jgi:hypothetical protein